MSVVVVFAPSCNRSGVITAPSIILDSETGIYTIKIGRDLVIAPEYESADDAEYKWTLSGEVIGSSPSLHFMREEVGQYFITLTVTNEVGQDLEEIRVDVIDLEIPFVSIAGSKSLLITQGAEVDFVATIKENSLETTLVWSCNGAEVSTDSTYKFTAQECGDYTIIAAATNEDGSSSDQVMVQVVDPADIPFEWEFASSEFHTVSQRRLLISPVKVGDTTGVDFVWTVGDSAQEQSGTQSFVFPATDEGEYTVFGTASLNKGGQQITLRKEFRVRVYTDGAFYRAKTSSSKSDYNEVFEYTPAPGQFINELKTGGFNGTQITPETAIDYAKKRMANRDKQGKKNPLFVSLGGFGGYIIVGFDHSIDNSGDYDLGILGNSFNGSSEPGIVWVMQDENGNGLPDDTWFELAGSETGKSETIQNYAVTYYRPSGPGMPVQWSDNKGNKGEIDYLKQFHPQEYYYPLWVMEDSYTLTGTCLKANNYDASGNGSYWVNPHYEWGYVDNWSPIDRLTNEDNANAAANANHFKISNAIDFECKPIDLKYIDFVKVQVGVNTKSGWLGEVSTEVFGFYDYNMKK